MTKILSSILICMTGMLMTAESIARVNVSNLSNANNTTGKWTEWRFAGAKFFSNRLECYYDRDFIPFGSGKVTKESKILTITRNMFTFPTCPKNIN